MKNTAIYVRVSTTNQNHRSQMPDLKQWAESHDGPVKWYRDKFTGKTMIRPGIEKLMQDINAGKIERIVIWRLDRLGRTAVELLQLCDELRTREVDFVSLRDGLMSLNSAAGRMFFGMLANFAQFENEVRSERRQAGMEAAKATKPAKALEMHNAGWDTAAIATMLRVSGSTVELMLERGPNKAYWGGTNPKGIPYKRTAQSDEVGRLLALGNKPDQIAKSLDISRSTVYRRLKKVKK